MKIQGCISRWFRLALAGVLASLLANPSLALADVPKQDVNTGFMVLATDRGFTGNEEITDAFEIFGKEHNASLVFITDERARKYIRAGLDTLLSKGAGRIVVIPLFISAAAPRYEVARQLLDEEKIAVPVSYARPYGESYFAVEDLADKFRTLDHPSATRVVVAGYGAVDEDSEREMHANLKDIAEKAGAGFGFASIRVVVANDKKGDEGEKRAAEFKEALIAATGDGDGSEGKLNTVVVPFHFGPKFDSMMSFDARLKRLLPTGVQLIEASGIEPGPESLATWLQYAANRQRQLARKDIGVVFLSHGSDFHWNQSMREAVQPLMDDYKIEFAFSMADQATIERAIRKLEKRGARAAVIVRMFAMEESFRGAVERMAGLDVEGDTDAPGHARMKGGSGHAHGHAHGHGHGHGGHGHGATALPAPRIRTPLPIQTVGGLGSSPLFAAALLDRARALSKNPERDTVILVGHGSGDDRQNEQWQRTLETIAEHMRNSGGSEFLAIKTATWREDWAEKRAPWIEKVRSMVAEAGRHGGRAIVIPARTTAEGPERRFLSGLEYDLGSGFAPHPKFVEWVKEEIDSGIAKLAHSSSTSGIVAANGRDFAGCFEKELGW